MIRVPAPPSTNELFVQMRGRRVKTAKYSKWLREAGWCLKGVQPVSPPYTVTINVGKANQARDPDNYFKAVLDLLVSNKILEGDNWKRINQLTINKAFDLVPEGFVDVLID